jgi:hypothetical protein
MIELLRQVPDRLEVENKQALDTGRPLKNIQFCSSTRKAIISTTGIHSVFRGLKFEPDAVIGQKRVLCKGLTGRLVKSP